MKQWFLAFVLMGGIVPSQTSTVVAQDSIPAPVVRNAAPVLLKFCPIHLLDPDNTLTAGVEIPLGRWTSVQQEVGFGISELNLFYSQRVRYDRFTTWRFRSQVRLYLSRSQTWPRGFYGALEFLHKRVYQYETRSVGRDCNPATGACSYFEITSEPRLKRVNAYHMKFGYQNAISRRFTIDAYLGFGLRSIAIREPGEPRPVNRQNDWFWSADTPGIYRPVPSLSAGFHVGYAISGPLNKKNGND